MNLIIDELRPDELKPIPEKLAFGRDFANRMFMQRYEEGKGWHDARITAYRPIALNPATTVFHYSQEIFEGAKAYRRPDGNINVFRLMQNMHRFNRSAARMAMAEVDPEAHFDAIVELIRMEHAWVPGVDGSSLYIRPTMIGIDDSLGVHASATYLHFVILSPVGPYFATGFNPVSVDVAHDHVRAVVGGTGAAKTGGNYAATLVAAQQAKDRGYQQVLWLDAVERRYIEEVGTMNIAFVYEGRHISTPALTGSILPGVTRDSVLKMAPDLGYTVSEDRLDIDEVIADIRRGKITEVFGTGTAVVIAPVGRIGNREDDVVINNNEAGPVAQHLFKALTDIQYGRVEDPYGWTTTIAVNGL